MGPGPQVQKCKVQDLAYLNIQQRSQSAKMFKGARTILHFQICDVCSFKQNLTPCTFAPGAMGPWVAQIRYLSITLIMHVQ